MFNLKDTIMKKPLFLLLSLISSAWGLLSAQPRTEADALNIAKQFLQDKYAVGQEGIRRVAPLKSVIQRAPVNKNIDSWNPFYIWNDEASNSFVIVSGDARMPSILGYAPNLFDEEKIPDALSELLSDYAAQFNVLQEQSITSSSTYSFPVSKKAELVLETPNWGQGIPFNWDCPQNSVTGCVATAMSIVMGYYNWPIQGNGSNEYVWYGNEGPVTLSADFSKTTYDWENMLLDYTHYTEEQGEAVAQLMYHAGVSVNMYYGDAASGATPSAAKDALIKYFDYDQRTALVSADDYTPEEWRDILMRELKSDRPVLYAGVTEKNDMGHVFVVDGYKDDLLHINWGWSGFYNGFFALGNLTPSDGIDGYNTQQSAIINIQPRLDTEKVSPIVLVRNEGIGYVTVDCRNVEKGYAFNFIIAANAEYPYDDSCTGDFCVALTGPSGNIKEIVGSEPIFHNGDAIGIPCRALCDIEQSDMLSLFFRETGTDELLPINWVDGKEVQVPVLNNEILTTEVTWEDPDHALWKYQFNPAGFDGKPIWGGTLGFWVNIPDNHVCKISSSTGWSYINERMEGVDYGYFSIQWLPREIGIKLDLIDLTERTEDVQLTVAAPGTLEQLASEVCPDFNKVKSLTLSGKIDARDFLWLSNYKLIESIDMSQVEIVAYQEQSANQIPERSFEGFTRLKTFVMPVLLESIGDGAFSGAVLESIVLPATVSNIGLNAFFSCPELKDVTVKNPDPLWISWCVFAFTKREEGTLHVPEGCLSAYQNASEWNLFQTIVDDVPNEVEVFSVNGIFYQTIPGYKDQYRAGVIPAPNGEKYSGKIVIPETVDYKGNKYLICEIGDRAFQDCNQLTSVVMSDSITKIGTSAFDNVTALAELKLSNNIRVLPNRSLVAIYDLKELSLPDSLIEVQEGAVSWVLVESLHLPAKLTKIYPNAFVDMNQLKDISVDPQNPNYAVLDGLLVTKDTEELILRPANNSSSRFVVPAPVKYIRTGAIQGWGIEELVIPETVLHLDFHSVLSCYDLVNIFVESMVPPFADENAFSSWCTENTVLKVPVGAKTAYEQAIGWSKFKKIEETSETSVNLPEANAAKIEYTSDGLYIWADSPVDYALYALNGTLLKQGRLQKGSNKILPSSRMGLILKVGNQTYKIINRD